MLIVFPISSSSDCSNVELHSTSLFFNGLLLPHYIILLLLSIYPSLIHLPIRLLISPCPLFIVISFAATTPAVHRTYVCHCRNLLSTFTVSEFSCGLMKLRFYPLFLYGCETRFDPKIEHNTHDILSSYSPLYGIEH